MKPEIELSQLATPDELPIHKHQAEIMAALTRHAVVIVAGETGSGKTTQLPKLCLAAGRGQQGLIGHTQPRRIAARAVATRIAQELKSSLGEWVGLKTRFDERLGENNLIRLMTDGILLAEIRSDPWLKRYDTLIIDEAHERSLNIDFLLGYLKRLLLKRDDLKLIITSATIDPASFSNYFNGAPIIEVSGRGFPVTVRYHSLLSSDPDVADQDLPQAILASIKKLQTPGAGDILVFLSGEREIRETAKFLRDAKLRDTEILPLYGRLSQAEQDRIFKPHIGSRVVLSTNVAETSLTVPGIHYVIDTGLARTSEYNYRYKVQRLPITKISQASADQRKGRCGRVAPGTCIRLYDEADFTARMAFTKPEILRTNLAGVILNMLDLRLGDIDDFPFIDKPDPRFIKAGYQLLLELGAIDERKQLTGLGKKMAKLPLDPKLGRMILAAEREHCLTEALIIVSALSIQDPREFPAEAKQAATQCHQEYADERSEFLSWLKLWECFEKQRQASGVNQLRKYCKTKFLSFVRMREWRDVHRQLLLMVQHMGMICNEQPADTLLVHRALLTGLLANVGIKDEEGNYRGIRELKFQIFPGSKLFKKRPTWVMSAEIIETSKVYAHCVAQIDPQWIEQVAGHLLKRSYSNPHWEKQRGQVVATERVVLFGLVVNASRKVNYGPIDPVVAREIFIKDGLIIGALNSPLPRSKFALATEDRCGRGAGGEGAMLAHNDHLGPLPNPLPQKQQGLKLDIIRGRGDHIFYFLNHNQALIARIEEQEEKARRRDILVEPEIIFQFYAAYIPSSIYDLISFEKWYKAAIKIQPQLLCMQESDLIKPESPAVTAEQFPDHIIIDDSTIALSYRFEPGHAEDGVTAIIPVTQLNQISHDQFEWLVPGLLEQKIIGLLKCLPKDTRRFLNLVNDYAKACLQAVPDIKISLLDFLAQQINRMTGLKILASAWQLERLPAELRMNFHVVDNTGKILAQGRVLQQLQEQLQSVVRIEQRTLSVAKLERDGIKSWDFGDLPAEVRSQQLILYPALVDNGDNVAIQLFDNLAEAMHQQQGGLARLLYLSIPNVTSVFNKQVSKLKEIGLGLSTIYSYTEFIDDFIMAVMQQCFLSDQPNLRTEQDFITNKDQNLKKMFLVAQELAEILSRIVTVRRELKPTLIPQLLAAIINNHLQQLLYSGFISQTPKLWLQRIPLYLKAILARIEKYRRAPQKDASIQHELQQLTDDYQKQLKKHPHNRELQLYYWMLEEYQISLFAQELKTLMPVSKKRLFEQLQNCVNNK